MRLPVFRFTPPRAAFVGLSTVVVIILTAGITYAATGGLKPSPKPNVQSSTQTTETTSNDGSQTTHTKTVYTHSNVSSTIPIGNSGSSSSSSQTNTATTTQTTTSNSGTSQNNSGSSPQTPSQPPLTALSLQENDTTSSTPMPDPTSYRAVPVPSGSMPNNAQYAFFWSNANSCATNNENATDLEACGTKVLNNSGLLQIPASDYSSSNPVAVVVCEYVNGQCNITSNVIYTPANP